ncbi:Uncharacterized protein dnl_50890 [Desulfonema limicola]|uniref:Uncharacterized protein n=1 Tax=Desulfonema limicola TaxID=45656 RepID=A0A975GIM3_9BACT|nr:Uncharacterized protein dnl_50890 [Desulfonema limicola]
MRKKKTENKKCPFVDDICLEEGCKIYNERLDNCEIYVLSYNLFRLSKQLESAPDLTSK